MNKLLPPNKKNKKGLSEMVSYVILIVIAIGLSTIVFAYLKVYIPKNEKPVCPDDISLILKNYTCQGKSIDIVLTNKGLFKADGVIIRFGGKDKKVLQQINNLEEFFDGKGLDAGETDILRSFPVTIPEGEENYKLEIEPLVQTEKGLALCSQSVITQIVSCN